MNRRYRSVDPLRPVAMPEDRCTHNRCSRPRAPGHKSCVVCLESARKARKKYVRGRAAAAAYLDAEWAKRKKEP